jgi:glycosyltransferase involved in cell wall biosynthesis
MAMPFVDFHRLHLECSVGAVLVAKDGAGIENDSSVCILNKSSRSRRLARLFFGSVRALLHPIAFLSVCPLNEIKYIGMAVDTRLRRAEAHLVEFATNAFLPLFLRSVGLIRGRIYVHFHGHDASSKLDSDNSYRKRILRVLKDVDGIIVVSQWQKDKLASYGVDVSKLNVIPCGAVIPKAIATPIDEGCTFTYIGRLLDNKGVMETLKAFNHCLQESVEKNLTLNVIGDGSLREDMLVFIDENDLEDHVIMHRHLPHNETMDILQRSSVYVQHSQTTANGWVEGWGVSMAEASGAGLPVIATRHGGIVDHQIDGVTGYLVEEGDWQAMARRMKELAESPKLRAELGSQRTCSYTQSR